MDIEDILNQLPIRIFKEEKVCCSRCNSITNKIRQYNLVLEVGEDYRTKKKKYYAYYKLDDSFLTVVGNHYKGYDTIYEAVYNLLETIKEVKDEIIIE